MSSCRATNAKTRLTKRELVAECLRAESEATALLAELRALREVAEAASDMATVHLNDAGPEGFIRLYRLRETLNAWRRLR